MITPADVEVLMECAPELSDLTETMLGLSTVEGITCSLNHTFLNGKHLINFKVSHNRRLIIFGVNSKLGMKFKIYPKDTDKNFINRILEEIKSPILIENNEGTIIVRR